VGIALMLAAAIGVTAATVGVLDSLVVRPLPFPDADRLVAIRTTRGFTGDVLRSWRASQAFEAVEMASPRGSRLATGSDTALVRSSLVTPGLMAMLDVYPLLGRLFEEGEGRPGSTDRVLVSETVWRTWFGADPGILGRRIDVDGQPRVVIGVMPSAFRFPEHDTALWMPVHEENPDTPIGGVVARLAPDVPRDDAELVARTIAEEAELTLSPPSFRPSLRDIQPPLDDRIRQTVVLLAAGAALLFLLACANAACLILTDLGRDQRRFATSSALGATRGRLMREVVAAQLPVGMAAAGLGVGLAATLVRLVPHVVPDAVQANSLNPIDLDTRVLVALTILACFAIAGASLLPAWVGTRLEAVTSMRGVREVGSPTRAFRLAAAGLLVAQVAVASAVLSATALVTRSFFNLATADAGLDAANVVSGFVLLPRSVTDAAVHRAAALAVDEALRALPEVASVTLSIGRPGRQPPPRPMMLTPGSSDAAGDEVRVNHLRVQPDYFGFYGIPIVEGRGLLEDDAPDDVVVSRSLADMLWPGGDVVGLTFRLGSASYRTVGVAADVTFPALGGESDPPELYSAFEPLEFFYVHLRCRTACPAPSAFDEPIRAAYPVQRIDLVPLAEEYAAELVQPRNMVRAALVFGGLAWLTAAGGLFGVLRYAVGRRRRELGIRAALGASPLQLRRLVLAQAARVVGVGLPIGAAIGLGLARGLSAVLYDVPPADPLAWAAVCAVLGVATLAAAWRPGTHAARAAPGELARIE
jgi:predicted permease